MIFSTVGPESEKDVMALLSAERMELRCRALEFAPHEYLDEDHSPLYMLQKHANYGSASVESEGDLDQVAQQAPTKTSVSPWDSAATPI